MRSQSEERLDGRVSNVIRIGKIVEARYGNPPAARVDFGNGAPSDWLRMGASRAGENRTWSPFEVGEEVVVASQSGSLSDGIVVCAIYNFVNGAAGSSADEWRMDFGNGTVISHDRGSGHVELRTAGDVSVDAGGRAEISAAGGVHVTGDVYVTGDVIADGISLVSHVHSGVTAGPSTTGGAQ